MCNTRHVCSWHPIALRRDCFHACKACARGCLRWRSIGFSRRATTERASVGLSLDTETTFAPNRPTAWRVHCWRFHRSRAQQARRRCPHHRPATSTRIWNGTIFFLQVLSADSATLARVGKQRTVQASTDTLAAWAAATNPAASTGASRSNTADGMTVWYDGPAVTSAACSMAEIARRSLFGADETAEPSARLSRMARAKPGMDGMCPAFGAAVCLW